MRVLCIHAHFDDFEFTCAGLFSLWRKKFGADLISKVIVCTDGKAGHHFRTREELGQIRLSEQQKSAEIGGYEFDVLRYPDGTIPREACMQVDTRLLAALWKVIRDFRPDYLFCPPLATDDLAGLHVDHVSVAEGIRKVAYMLNVPHAFTPEYPTDETRSEPVTVPVILNTYDGYMFGSNAYDLAFDISPAFDDVATMSFCHQSQIMEWLPWVGRHKASPPADLRDWKEILGQRFLMHQKGLGIPAQHPYEVFKVTAWGEVPSLEKLLVDFPTPCAAHSNLQSLGERLKTWRLE